MWFIFYSPDQLLLPLGLTISKLQISAGIWNRTKNHMNVRYVKLLCTYTDEKLQACPAPGTILPVSQIVDVPSLVNL